jgi:hypothetical protein
MASDRPFDTTANGTCNGDVHGTIGRVAPVQEAHDQFNHIDQITTPTPSDYGTQPPNPRTSYFSRILQYYRNVSRRRFAADLRLAPPKFYQGTRDGLHSSFARRSSKSESKKSQAVLGSLSGTALIRRPNPYSTPDIPRLNPINVQAKTRTHRQQNPSDRKSKAMSENDQTIVSDEPVSLPKSRAVVKATGGAENARRKRRCSGFFNKSFNFGPSSKPNTSQASPRVSPRSSISSGLSTLIPDEPAKRRRIGCLSTGALCSHLTHSPRATAPDGGYSTDVFSVANSHQCVTRDMPPYSTPHPGYPVDFTTHHLEPHIWSPATDPELCSDPSLYDACSEPLQWRSSFPKAYLRHQIAEEFSRRGRLKHEEEQDEMERTCFVTQPDDIVQESSASSKSSARPSRKSSARTSSSGDTDSTEAFLRHVRASFEARKRKELGPEMFEDEVGRAYVCSEPL